MAATCLMCGKEMPQRGGKVVCGSTCRVLKKNAFDYFKNVFSIVKKLRPNVKDDEVLQGMYDDEVFKKRPTKYFIAWVKKYHPNSTWLVKRLGGKKDK